MVKTCLLDMDNVFVDFLMGSFALHGIKLTAEQVWANSLGAGWNYYELLGLTAGEFYAPMDEDYWANLPWTPDGEHILEMVERRFGRENVVIATTPTMNTGCHAGKIRWIERHMPRHYSTSRGQMMGASKWLMSNPAHMLVDDSDENCEKFASYGGGHVCLVPRHWNREYENRGRVIEHVARVLGL